MKVQSYAAYVNGKWVQAENGNILEVRCPADQELVATVPEMGIADIDQAVRAAKATFLKEEWSSHMNAPTRGKLLREIGRILHERVDELAKLESLSSGKPILETSLIDIHMAADCFEYYADLAAHIAGRQVPLAQQALDFTLREPIGVVGMIVPFNFPLLLASFKVAPALAAGNTVVLKPSEFTPLTALELAKIAEEVGVPEGVFNVVTGSAEAGKALAEHADIDKLSFTGSTNTARSIVHGSSNSLKRLTLELGGKGPNLLFADCDLDQAINGVMTGAFMNQGEVCIAGTRILVQESIFDEFIKRFIPRVEQLPMGHPLDWNTRVGALISKAQLDKVEYFVRRGLEEGGRILCGGRRPQGEVYDKGFFFEPTVFVDLTNDCEVCQEEIFGPVVVVIPFSDEEEAILLANDSKYGLAGGVWTKDIKKGLRAARRLKLGTVWVNNYNLLRVEAPFGGYKMSGFGRELGLEALSDYTQVKNVYVELEDEILYLYD